MSERKSRMIGVLLAAAVLSTACGGRSGVPAQGTGTDAETFAETSGANGGLYSAQVGQTAAPEGANSADTEEDSWLESAWTDFRENTDYHSEKVRSIYGYTGFLDLLASEDIEATDYDGDGTIDRIYQNYSGSVGHCYLFMGSGECLDLGNCDFMLGKLTGADVTGDGRNELVLIEDIPGADNPGAAYARVWENTGDGWKQMELPFAQASENGSSTDGELLCITVMGGLTKEGNLKITVKENGAEKEIALAHDDLDHLKTDQWVSAYSEDIWLIPDAEAGRWKLRVYTYLGDTGRITYTGMRKNLVWDAVYRDGQWTVEGPEEFSLLPGKYRDVTLFLDEERTLAGLTGQISLEELTGVADGNYGYLGVDKESGKVRWEAAGIIGWYTELANPAPEQGMEISVLPEVTDLSAAEMQTFTLRPLEDGTVEMRLGGETLYWREKTSDETAKWTKAWDPDALSEEEIGALSELVSGLAEEDLLSGLKKGIAPGEYTAGSHPFWVYADLGRKGVYSVWIGREAYKEGDNSLLFSWDVQKSESGEWTAKDHPIGEKGSGRYLPAGEGTYQLEDVGSGYFADFDGKEETVLLLRRGLLQNVYQSALQLQNGTSVLEAYVKDFGEPIPESFYGKIEEVEKGTGYEYSYRLDGNKISVESTHVHFYTEDTYGETDYWISHAAVGFRGTVTSEWSDAILEQALTGEQTERYRSICGSALAYLDELGQWETGNLSGTRKGEILLLTDDSGEISGECLISVDGGETVRVWLTVGRGSYWGPLPEYTAIEETGVEDEPAEDRVAVRISCELEFS